MSSHIVSRSIIAISACLTMGQASASQGASQPAAQAMGVIVKLKDGAGQVAASDMASPAAMSAGVAQQRRLLTAQLAQRHRVSFLVQKDTVFGAQVLHRGTPSTLAEAEAEAQRLRQDPSVEWAVPNEMLKSASMTSGQPVPPVSYAGRFWAESRASSGAGVADFPAAWGSLVGRSLSPVVTAVLDSGVVDYSTHPDFVGRLHTGYDFVTDPAFSNDGDGRDGDVSDPGDAGIDCPGLPEACSSWHGTSVTSMLSSPRDSADNGFRMGPGILASIDGQPVVLPVRIGGVGGTASTSDIIEGMYWAAGLPVAGIPNNTNPARVINLSYGADGDCRGGSGSVDALYRSAISTLRSLGVVVVASAGNGDGSGSSGRATPTKPASCQGVIAATGLRADATKAAYANLVNGTRASQCYYGVAIASGDVGQGIALLSNSGTTAPMMNQVRNDLAGTSFAAPQVAGVAALMLAVNPALSSVDVAYRISQSATAFPASGAACSPSNLGNCGCTAETCGSGVLDAAAAIVAAEMPSEYDDASCPAPDVEGGSPGSEPEQTPPPAKKKKKKQWYQKLPGAGGAVSGTEVAILGGVAAWLMWSNRRRRDQVDAK